MLAASGPGDSRQPVPCGKARQRRSITANIIMFAFALCNMPSFCVVQAILLEVGLHIVNTCGYCMSPLCMPVACALAGHELLL